MAVKKPAGFATGGLFCCVMAYLRFLAGVPPRALGSLLPPRAAGALLALLFLLVAAILLLPRVTSWLLASARALRAARLGR